MTTKPTLIALCSPAMGSGKTEVANHLEREHGFLKVRFAAPLKAMTHSFLRSLGYGYDACQRMVDGDLKQVEIAELPGISPRRVMQTLGTEWGRKCIHEDLWTYITRQTVERHLAAGFSVVIDDMRFPNEYAMATQALGGHALRIVRPGRSDTTGHASEGQLNGFVMDEIVNDGSLEDLWRDVDALVSRVK